ncbi:hypothetical protein RQP46_008715 [Phenoliferia psychrophenolica]
MFKPNKVASSTKGTPPSKDIAEKIAELKSELPPADPAGESRLRNIYDWSVGHASIAFDVLSLVPPTAPFAPLVKLVIGVAILPADGKEATDSCRGLMERLVTIHLESLPLRTPGQVEHIDDEMDKILSDLHAFVMPHFKKNVCSGIFSVPAQMWGITKGLKSGIVLENVKAWTKRVDDLQADYIPQVMCVLLLWLHLVGRDRDIDKTVTLLTVRSGHNTTEHVAIVGLGGIGKTSLATKIIYDARSELLKLRAPKPLQPGEDLERAVREQLDKEPLFLILDNLLDKSDKSHNTYFQYITKLTSIPTLTLLITSRNHSFLNEDTTRMIRGIKLRGLTDDQADQLFRKTYTPTQVADHDRPALAHLLKPLEGIPLAIRLVAKYAFRTKKSLADVATLWKQGEGWDNGRQDRESDLDFSLALSFSDVAVAADGTMTLLRLLAELPEPILLSRGGHSAPVTRAVTAIVERSVGQRDSSAGESYLRILEPVREYIRRHHRDPPATPLDIGSTIIQTLARDYFRTAAKTKVKVQLAKLIKRDDLTKVALSDYNYLIQYRMTSGQTTTTLETSALKESGNSYKEAGDFFLKHDHFEEGASSLQNAVEALQAQLRQKAGK